MKIIRKDAVYVQMNDLMFLNGTDIPIPDSIFLKIFGQGTVVVNNSNRYNFVKFEDESEIEYFKELDWIIDYDSVKELDKDEINQLVNQIVDKEQEIADKFNNLPENEKVDNFDMVARYEELEYKEYSLRSFVSFKQGKTSMELPDNIEYPTDYKPTIKNAIKQFIKRKPTNQ